MIELYGITNCDTVKKARNWLAENNIVYEFSDFKKNAPSEAVIRQWLEQVPLETLLNKRGTTWRKLDDADRQAAENNLEEAIRLIRIKKPDAKVVVGGAVMTQEYADAIGADFYGKEAMDTVRYADTLFPEET